VLRTPQNRGNSIAYAHRIALLRSYYLLISPELEPYLVILREPQAAPFHGTPGAWQLTLTAAGMVAVVNSVVVSSCAGLVLVAAGVDTLAIPVAAGALVGAGAFALHHRHHRRARDRYSPQGVDQAAIVVPSAQPADAA
jgi:hypothetical protein